MKITVEHVMTWRPCPEYPESRIRGVIGTGIEHTQITELEIPAADRVWLACQWLARHNPDGLSRFARRCTSLVDAMADRATARSARSALAVLEFWEARGTLAALAANRTATLAATRTAHVSDWTAYWASHRAVLRADWAMERKRQIRHLRVILSS